MTGILGIIVQIVLRLFGLQKKSAQPSADERAGRAEAKLETVTEAQADVQKAVAASRAANDRAILDPASVRAPDPNSRD